mgnify:CR=1 FL=1
MNTRSESESGTVKVSKSQSAIPATVVKLLQQFETRSAFERLGPVMQEIETVEVEIVESRGVISTAEMVLEDIEARFIVAGVEGKNETERKAKLVLACRDDALYMRAVSEIDRHRTSIGLGQSKADRLKRECRALTLEIEARNASKLLVAGVSSILKN